MGEARCRGTFEERKAQAIKAGRSKGKRTFKQNPRFILPPLDPYGLMALLGLRERQPTKGNRRR